MEWLYQDKDEMDIERRSLLPSERFFTSNDILRDEAETDVREATKNANAVVLTDPDADGLGVVLAVRQKHSDVNFVPCGPHTNDITLNRAIELTAEGIAPGSTVYVGDIGPDDVGDIEALSDLSEKAGDIYWWDHHEWTDDVVTYVESHVTELILDDGDDTVEDAPNERCGAQIARDELVSEGVEMPESVQDAIDTTAVYDLWRKKTDENGNELKEFVDERARDINDFVKIVDDYDEYLSVLEEYGADVLTNTDVRNRVSNHRVHQKNLRALAVQRAESETIEGVSVAITYGRCPQNDVADDLRENGADLVVVVKPSGGISLRGSENFEKCHTIAREFDGGGHSRAAGCFIAPRNNGETDRYETDMLDYAEHWTTEGEYNKQRVREVIQDVI